ncbi:MAG: hypothetical protein ACR2K4_04570 [Candidatus Limnocylindria bacterium]
MTTDQQTTTTPPTATTGRPLGITIMAIIAGIFGVLGLLAGLALFGLSGLLGAVGGASVAGQGMLSSLFALVTAIIALAFAYGAWTLKPWAWPLGLAFAGFAVVSGVIGLASGDTGASSVIIGLVIAGVVAWYLMTPGVKAAFGRT